MTNLRNSTISVVIVGAGPYGLSLAAHLREAGIPFRIFGRPMQTWATQMPAGMKLKSDGFASNLSAGSRPFTLEDFCRLTGRQYHHTALPVAVEDFVAYGEEFARRFVPHLEPCDVVSMERRALLDRYDRLRPGFHITLSNGEHLRAHHVIVATGLSLFQHIPGPLNTLPRELVTHTADHTHFSEFVGKEVVVLGRGASSLNAAVLLHEAGGRVTLVTRTPRIYVHPPATPGPRPLYHRIRYPQSPLGYSLRSWVSCAAPGLFHALPAPLRRSLAYKHLGPAGGSALHGRYENKFPMLLGWSVESTEILPGESGEPVVQLTLINQSGGRRTFQTSHIIAGTGYRIALSRMRFLSDTLRTAIHVQKSGAPVLSRHFQSSVHGLYFVGPVGAPSFGPLLRFAAGAEFAARQVTTLLQRVLELKPVSVPDAQEQTAPLHG